MEPTGGVHAGLHDRLTRAVLRAAAAFFVAGRGDVPPVDAADTGRGALFGGGRALRLPEGGTVRARSLP